MSFSRHLGVQFIKLASLLETWSLAITWRFLLASCLLSRSLPLSLVAFGLLSFSIGCSTTLRTFAHPSRNKVSYAHHPQYFPLHLSFLVLLALGASSAQELSESFQSAWHPLTCSYSCRYSALLVFFPIGLLTPIPFYFLAQRFPLGIWRYINIPIFFGPLIGMPTASGIAYSSFIICGFIFNYVIRRFHLRWWMQYNYILGVALTAGTAISMTVIFFTLTVPKAGGIQLNWWGNRQVSCSSCIWAW